MLALVNFFDFELIPPPISWSLHGKNEPCRMGAHGVDPVFDPEMEKSLTSLSIDADPQIRIFLLPHCFVAFAATVWPIIFPSIV